MTTWQTAWIDLRDRIYFVAISLPLAIGLAVVSSMFLHGITSTPSLSGWHAALASLTAWTVTGPSQAVIVWQGRTAILAAVFCFWTVLLSAGRIGPEACFLAVWATGVALVNPKAAVLMPVGVAFGQYLGRVPMETMAATLIMATVVLAPNNLRRSVAFANAGRDGMISIYDFLEEQCHDR